MEKGHEFLKRLGKTKLRPGGIKATKFLLSHIDFNKNPIILEVACNNGNNIFMLAKKYKNATFYGIDSDINVINEALDRNKKEKLENVKFFCQNAMDTKFDNMFFDYIINEAMLTMINPTIKLKILNEYNRILKKEGLLLTHDIIINDNEDEKQIQTKMSRVLKMDVTPLYLNKWVSIYNSANFQIKNYKTGKLTLFSPRGMIRDEGLFRMFKILKNGMKKENKQRFLETRKTLHKDLGNKINYVAFVSEK